MVSKDGFNSSYQSMPEIFGKIGLYLAQVGGKKTL